MKKESNYNKNDNFYKLTWFERFCLISIKILNFFVFLYCFQQAFPSKYEEIETKNIVFGVICCFVCVLYFGWFLANNKINEKIGALIESNERLNDLSDKYLDTITKNEKKDE